MSFLLGTLAVLGVIGMLLTSNGSSSTNSSSTSTRSSSRRSHSGSGSAGTNCVFTVTNPEGELYSVDTSDKNSPFYGPVWRRILKAYTNGECFRGRAVKRSCGKADGAFHGYFIDISGVQAFLPVSKAAWFYSSEHDACGKSLALMIADIHPNGPKAGSIVVDAYKPLKHVLTSQNRKAFNPGAEPWLLAMDYEKDDYNTPRIAGAIGLDGEGFVGIVRDDGIEVIKVNKGETYYVSTYEHNSPRAVEFEATNAGEAADYIYGEGSFAEFTNPVTSCAVFGKDGWEIAFKNP